PVELHVQSSGGALMPALAIVDTICRSPVPVHSFVEGFAASAATLMTVVCAVRYAHPNSLMLIHQMSGGAEGTLAQVGDRVDGMRTIDKLVKNVYLMHTRMASDDLDELMKHDVWMTASECMHKGIVDEI
ncbi:ClpP/crotonase-like domain-containing protein, partial [Tribonema minus]